MSKSDPVPSLCPPLPPNGALQVTAQPPASRREWLQKPFGVSWETAGSRVGALQAPVSRWRRGAAAPASPG